MKKIIPLFLIVSASFIGCERIDKLSEPYSNGVTVVKLEKSEYKNYMVVSEMEDALCLIRTNIFGVSDSIKSPYRELANGYLLIDWRWYLFPYLPTLIYEDWVADDGDIQCWDKDNTSYVEKPLQCYFVDMAKVNALLKTKEAYTCDYEEARREHIYDDLDIFRMKTAHMDSVWDVTEKQISIIIENGDFDSIAERQYQFE